MWMCYVSTTYSVVCSAAKQLLEVSKCVCIWFTKSSQEYPVNAGGSFLKGPFLVIHFSYYTLMTFLMMLSVILLSLVMILLSKGDQTSDLWQQLELDSQLESDLQYTVDWGRKWLVDFSAEKTQVVLFDRSKNTGAIDVKMDGLCS